MTNEKIHPDLDEIISHAEAGIVNTKHKKLWNRFKKEWSEEDRVFWRKFEDKMIKDKSGVLRLSPPLSADEKAWAKGFVKRAKEIGLC